MNLFRNWSNFWFSFYLLVNIFFSFSVVETYIEFVLLLCHWGSGYLINVWAIILSCKNLASFVMVDWVGIYKIETNQSVKLNEIGPNWIGSRHSDGSDNIWSLCNKGGGAPPYKSALSHSMEVCPSNFCSVKMAGNIVQATKSSAHRWSWENDDNMGLVLCTAIQHNLTFWVQMRDPFKYKRPTIPTQRSGYKTYVRRGRFKI